MKAMRIILVDVSKEYILSNMKIVDIKQRRTLYGEVWAE